MRDTSALTCGLIACCPVAPVKLGNLTDPAVGARVVGGGSELSPTEVAREFSVSASTVRRWEDTGVLVPTRRLPGSGYRRYSREAVDELKRRIEAGELDSSEGASSS